MTQKTEDEVIDQVTDELPPEDEQDIDPDNPDGELRDEQGDTVEAGAGGDEAESFDVTIEGFEPEQEDSTKPKKGDPDWVNQLRKDSRELKRLKRQIDRGQINAAPDVDDIGPEPTLENPTGNPDHAFDEVEFKKAHREWLMKSIKVEEQKKQKQQAEEQAQRSFQEKLAKYGEERKSIPVDDYEDAEEAVQSALNEVQIGILIKNAPEKAKLVYAIGKNDKALQHLAAIKDPDTYAVELGRIIERMKSTSTQKKAIPTPERVVRSGGGGKTAAMTSDNLEKLRQEGLKRGDLTEYYRAREKSKA
jgi:hypothetical protein